jgi:signal transduction histidine kinase
VVEPDEFTRRAIAAALTPDTPPVPPRPIAELPRDFAETYRYVTERLCHQVRNALAPADTELLRLERVLRTLTDPDARSTITEILGGLQAGFDRAARAVEFDRGDGPMTWDSIDLGEWLRRAAVGFAGRYGHLRLSTGPSPNTPVRVWAAPFLLEIVFGNLWSNAVHAVGAGSDFGVELTHVDGMIEALIRDSGPGFDETARAAAFDARYSTRPGNTGRGLLEVAEAVDRLHGRVGLVAADGGGYRVVVRLPQEGT